ncbi:rod shape-determining protein MreD [Silvibacterium bohemicum]|uniref:Rod shape-determining protein MreD n=1 Tax=Silvibacterium bohemicum TaxID=1577686 RepID=A0A841JXB8_9BACT|nr:rod shape-determining protein MreD [Silvibacterium bohemicum]MBB6146053.1 rod shape-determining protein MreD [Silvibacterium bohemicum]
MALMASTRREVDERSFPLFIYILAPLLALGLQSLVTLHFLRFGMLDLPLMVVVYFAMARRNPVTATLGGAAVGILQDALTHQPIGVFGIAKAFIGYLAASLGVRIDTEAHGTRLVLTFLFMLLHNGIDWVLVRHLLAQPLVWNWLHELLRAAINALIAVVLFALLDRARIRE